MRSRPRWRSFFPTSRQIRFSLAKQIDQIAPGLCRIASISTREADFSALSRRGFYTHHETAEDPFPSHWMKKFKSDFVSELTRENTVPSSCQFEIQLGLATNVWVSGRSGQIVDTDTNLSLTQVHYNTVRSALLTAHSIDGIAFSFIRHRPCARHYYHYLTEDVPECLNALAVIESRIGPVTVLLSVEEHPLDQILYHAIRHRWPAFPILRVKRQEKYYCSSMIVCRSNYSSRFRRPVSRRCLAEVTEASRQTFVVRPTQTNGRFLYVSRADAGMRRILNEQVLRDRLQAKGFECVVPGQLSIEEQIQIFSEARIVVGAHGNGLTNIMFMSEGSTVIEIFGNNFVHGAYAWISHLRRHNYNYVISSGTADVSTQHFSLSSHDLKVLDSIVAEVILKF